MTKTKRILIAKRLEHVVNLNIVNGGDKMLDHHGVSVDKMTTKEIKNQISMQKIHNARTKRAKENLKRAEKLHAHYGCMYTQAEINLLCDLHPYFKKMKEEGIIEPKKLSEKEIFETLKTLKQVEMLKAYMQEDNRLMI